jgi:hypothetical protein
MRVLANNPDFELNVCVLIYGHFEVLALDVAALKGRSAVMLHCEEEDGDGDEEGEQEVGEEVEEEGHCSGMVEESGWVVGGRLG